MNYRKSLTSFLYAAFLDLRTQLSQQTLDRRFIGMIVSCFNTNGDLVRKHPGCDYGERRLKQQHFDRLLDYNCSLHRQTRSRSHAFSPPTTLSTSNYPSVSSTRTRWTLLPCQNFSRSLHGSLTNNDSPSTSPCPCKQKHRKLDRVEVVEVGRPFSKTRRRPSQRTHSGIARAM